MQTWNRNSTVLHHQRLVSFSLSKHEAYWTFLIPPRELLSDPITSDKTQKIGCICRILVVKLGHNIWTRITIYQQPLIGSWCIAYQTKLIDVSKDIQQTPCQYFHLYRNGKALNSGYQKKKPPCVYRLDSALIRLVGNFIYRLVGNASYRLVGNASYRLVGNARCRLVGNSIYRLDSANYRLDWTVENTVIRLKNVQFVHAKNDVSRHINIHIDVFFVVFYCSYIFHWFHINFTK